MREGFTIRKCEGSAIGKGLAEIG